MARGYNPVFRSIEKHAIDSEGTKVSYWNIVLKTGILALIMIVIGVLIATFGITTSNEGEQLIYDFHPWVFIALAFGGVVSFVSVLLASFIPRLAMPFSILYSVAQGAFLGSLTAIIEIAIPGVAISAIGGTVVLFLVMLFLYASKKFRVTNRFLKFMSLSMIVILITSLLSLIIGWAYPSVYEITPRWLIILITAIMLLYAAFTLMLDFDFANTVVEMNLGKGYEWMASLGFMVTLVWIYVQILRLLVVLFSRKE